MKIARLIFNPIQENTYVVWDETLEAAVIDAGNMGERENEILAKFISDNGLKPVLALNTHGHFDHLLGVNFLREKYGAKLAMSSKDDFLLKNASVSAELFGVRAGDLPEAIDIDLEGQESISFGATTLKIISVPGHTPGHVAFYEPQSKVLFTGDTLFRESIGRTDLPGGDYSWIMRSIIDNILPLGDEVKIYPGHGDVSDLGHESMYNPFVVEVLNNEVNYKN
ncbi:MAG: MBL fold metallo-hydrolase [Rikenellaceae bacterium]|nr:MBL fold metallo-hydrolase [Rikenellaceae bacterium]